MLFCSVDYLLFFLLVFTLYWAIPWTRPRVYLLLAASYYFYACWNQWLACIIFASTTLDYLLAHAIANAPSPRKRATLVGVSVCANLGVLCYFKYVNFFLDSLTRVLHSCGAEYSLPTLSILLPIGISFYTFEAISYIVDVSRGRLLPERNLANFLLFILFFPHLVAGPIVRARDFLPQIRRAKRFSWPRAQVGVQLFLLGLVKKLVLADRMALFADPVFADPSAHTTGTVWLALIAYALQIYGDFSGYSDMALGTAHLFGYHLSKNFDMPYLAANVAEFWRRWHISLSTWLRDYLYVGLGGSRGGRWQTYRNLLITMTLGGLWHGASWNFALWGVLHGMLLIAYRLFQDFCRGKTRLITLLDTTAGTALRCGVTSLAVCLCWVFFRAETFAQAQAFFTRLVVAGGGLSKPMPSKVFFFVVALVILGHLLGQRRLWQRLLDRLPAPVLGVGYALFLSVTLVLTPPTGKTFIYFQF